MKTGQLPPFRTLSSLKQWTSQRRHISSVHCLKTVGKSHQLLHSRKWMRFWGTLLIRHSIIGATNRSCMPQTASKLLENRPIGMWTSRWPTCLLRGSWRTNTLLRSSDATGISLVPVEAERAPTSRSMVSNQISLGNQSPRRTRRIRLVRSGTWTKARLIGSKGRTLARCHSSIKFTVLE